MTLKHFQSKVLNSGGTYQEKDNGTTVYSRNCSKCNCSYTILMATLILQNQLGAKGQYAPKLYLDCNVCSPIPNRVTLRRESNAA